MNWDAVGALSELGGAIAVVCTLFYLAKQVNEAKRQVEANSITALNTLYNDAFLPIYNNQKNMGIWLTGLDTPDKLDANDKEIFFLFMLRIVSPFETAAIQYGKGTLDYETLVGYSSIPRTFLSKPGGIEWLKLNGGGMTVLARKIISDGA